MVYLQWLSWQCNTAKARYQLRRLLNDRIFQIRIWNSFFSALKMAGLVKSLRGAHGGYVLARDPDDITIGEIIRALEGPIELADCLEGFACAKSPECVTKGLWKEINDSISNIIDNRSLQDLLTK